MEYYLSRYRIHENCPTVLCIPFDYGSIWIWNVPSACNHSYAGLTLVLFQSSLANPDHRTFYTPREQGLRFSYLYLSVGLSGAFGGLFAFLLLKLDGRAGLEGWRWLYIVEGIISVFIAVLLAVGTPDSYEKAKFLNEDDKIIMRLRT